MDFSAASRIEKTDALICFCDIQSFRSIVEATRDPVDLFTLLNGMAETIIDRLQGTSGYIVKFIGDACLIVFPPGDADRGVRILLDVKRLVESYFKRGGFSVTMRFCVHFGEVVYGPYGKDQYRRVDVFGDPVNAAAVLARGEHRGRFIISPEAFRKLKPDTRKRFSKHMPPIVYLAEE